MHPEMFVIARMEYPRLSRNYNVIGFSLCKMPIAVVRPVCIRALGESLAAVFDAVLQSAYGVCEPSGAD